MLAFRDAEREFLVDRDRLCAQVTHRLHLSLLQCNNTAVLFEQPVWPRLRSHYSSVPISKSAQADAEQRKMDEEARYQSCTLLPAPDNARGLAAFLASGKPDPALCEPVDVLASCKALHFAPP